jgi:membrane protein
MAKATRRDTLQAAPRLPALHHAGRLRPLASAAIAAWNDNVIGMSGMIAFFGFLALIPIALLLLAFAGDVMGSKLPSSEVQKLFHDAVPGLSQHQFLVTYWEPVRHSKVTTRVLGVVSLFFGTLGLHDSVDWAVNRIWQSERSRRFWVAKLRGLAVIVWVVAFVLLSVSLAGLWTVLLGLLHVSLDAAWTALVPALALDTAVFAALYKLTPTAPVSTRAALLAGALGAALWEVSKFAFGWWVLQEGTYNRVYGPLAASVIVMLWLWISAIIFLYGAELASVLQRRHASPPPFV